MSLVILGGSSPWTFDLVQRIGAADITLVGRDEVALGALQEFLASHVGVRVRTSVDPIGSLRGASLVVCQARIGGYLGRFEDENHASRWGCYGDETLGVGGLRGAIRAQSTIESWARAAGDAPTIMVSNPTDLLARLWRSVSGSTVISACEAPSKLLGSLPSQSGFLGVNHLGYAVTRAGEIHGLRWTELLNDLPLHVENQQVHGVPRAWQLLALSRRLRQHVVDGAYVAFSQALVERPPFWYQELLAPLINAMIRDEDFAGVVGRPNSGVLGSVPEDVYIEATHAGLKGLPAHATNQVVDTVSRWAGSRDFAWSALLDTRPKPVEEFLLHDPFSAPLPSDIGEISAWLRSAR